MLHFYRIRPVALTMLCSAVLASCVDRDYDLSDIDTTVRVDVNDLTIPIQLDEILLGNIIKENDRIKIVDGNYCVVQEGSFSTGQIKLGKVSVSSVEIPSVHYTVPFMPNTAGGDDGYFNLSAAPQPFALSATGIPSEITAINSVGTDFSVNFSFNFSGLSSFTSRVAIEGLTIQLPKGLTLTRTEGGDYSPSTGLIVLPTQQLIGERIDFEFKASAIDFIALGADYNRSESKLSIAGDCRIVSGRVVLNAADAIAGATPQPVSISISADIPAFEVKSFSGGVDYTISGVHFSDIDLSDIPDVLSQPGTNISLANPCIFISASNPVQNLGLSVSTGLSLEAFHGSASGVYSLDGSPITVGTDRPDAVYNFCLSPGTPASVPPQYAPGLVNVPFTSLSDVLSGNGIPSRISVNLDHPSIVNPDVPVISLDTNLGTLTGSYCFQAPIALKAGSKIVFSDITGGWGGEDLDYLTVSSLTVKAVVTSEIPVSLDFTAYPVDINGRRIGDVEVRGASITASDNPQEVTITITGAIKGLDGIEYRAEAVAADATRPLSPDMTIRISNLRPTVSGYYQKEL